MSSHDPRHGQTRERGLDSGNGVPALDNREGFTFRKGKEPISRVPIEDSRGRRGSPIGFGKVGRRSFPFIHKKTSVKEDLCCGGLERCECICPLTHRLRNCPVCAGMGTPKPRILPWLVSQLDLGQLKGVAWLDESRTKFRIPWKHGLRQDAQMADFGIFQVLGGKTSEAFRGVAGQGLGLAN